MGYRKRLVNVRCRVKGDCSQPKVPTSPMPTASQRVLLDFFQHDLPFTPTAGQVDQFERDLALVSPNLMRAALKEAKAGRALVNRPFAERRAAIFQVYFRKVAEHAQLFPIFHTFETAFRSTAAVELETHYGRPDWWAPVRQALRSGQPARSVTHLRGIPISRNAAHQIGRIILALEGENLSRPVLTGVADGYEFTELCDLSHIGGLVSEHWSVFAPSYFTSPTRMTAADFSAKFTRVRDARNDIYHHKSVARMTNVVSAAEELLDRLGCSLDFAYKKITGFTLSPPAFSIPPADRHNIW